MGEKWKRALFCIASDAKLSFASVYICNITVSEFTTNEDMACLSLHGHQPQEGDVNRLEELMSEELARELQREENIRAGLTPDAQNYFYMLPPSDMPPINHG